jgi:hypothetical protein
MRYADLVGAVDLAIVDLLHRVRAGRGLARIEWRTGQAVELRREGGRPDDGHRHVMRRPLLAPASALQTSDSEVSAGVISSTDGRTPSRSARAQPERG